MTVRYILYALLFSPSSLDDERKGSLWMRGLQEQQQQQQQQQKKHNRNFSSDFFLHHPLRMQRKTVKRFLLTKFIWVYVFFKWKHSDYAFYLSQKMRRKLK